MEQPQGQDEVARVVGLLRQLDPLLDIRWEPRAMVDRYGGFDAEGHRIDPHWGGRWQVIRRESDGAKLHEERDYVVLCTVTAPVRIGARQILIMQENGPYAPVGEWLVEFMNTWDAAQRAFMEHMDVLAAENERVSSVAAAHDSGAAREAAEKVYHQTVGEHFIGRGFGQGPRRAAATTT